MRFQSQFSTNALQTLQRETAALGIGSLTPLALSHSINTIDIVLVDLGSQILDDGLGMHVESEEELIFRTSRMIIKSQLDELDGAIRHILASGLPKSEKPSLWQGFLDAIPLAKSELWRVTRIWSCYRRSEPASDDPARAAAARLALGRAFEELRNMGDIPEVERLLYRGIAFMRWPEIARSCEQILVAIHVNVDITAARRQWQAHRRWQGAVRSR